MVVQRENVTLLWEKTYPHPDRQWQRMREVMFLAALDGVDGFPKLVKLTETALYLRHCGEWLVEARPPVEMVREQLAQILEELEGHRIRHRDITGQNLVWDWEEERLTLVDFGWSVWDWEEDTPVTIRSAVGEDIVSDREQAEKVLEWLREVGGRR
jgi:tRNA A-37 threonylcarbamoyl transferase component Bud32